MGTNAVTGNDDYYNNETMIYSNAKKIDRVGID